MGGYPVHDLHRPALEGVFGHLRAVDLNAQDEWLARFFVYLFLPKTQAIKKNTGLNNPKEG